VVQKSWQQWFLDLPKEMCAGRFFSSDILLGQGVIGSFGMQLGFWKLKATAGIGNVRNQSIWRA
jgi:hypothetical protein